MRRLSDVELSMLLSAVDAHLVLYDAACVSCRTQMYVGRHIDNFGHEDAHTVEEFLAALERARLA